MLFSIILVSCRAPNSVRRSQWFEPRLLNIFFAFWLLYGFYSGLFRFFFVFIVWHFCLVLQKNIPVIICLLWFASCESRLLTFFSFALLLYGFKYNVYFSFEFRRCNISIHPTGVRYAYFGSVVERPILYAQVSGSSSPFELFFVACFIVWSYSIPIFFVLILWNLVRSYQNPYDLFAAFEWFEPHLLRIISFIYCMGFSF